MRVLKAAIATIALTGALAQPAAAMKEHDFTNTQSKDGHSITLYGAWQTQRIDSAVHLAFECYANTAPLAISIGLRECYVEGADGTRYQGLTQDNPEANEGPVTADGNVVPNIKDQRHRICLSAAAQWPDGGYQFATTLACSPFA